MKYAITLTLAQKFYKHEPEQQHIIMSQIIDELRDYKITMIAELTKQQNVHSHGTIDIEGDKDLKKFWNIIRKCEKLPKGTYAICLKQIEDEAPWIEYCRKDLSKTKDIINADPWYKDDFGYKNAQFKINKDGVLYWSE